MLNINEVTFSVIIPVFNRENTIHQAIQSVLNQTYHDFELIIVDDCSKDQTIAAVRSFNDTRMQLIKTKINNGAGTARNLGIRSAKGKYISFLDSDDTYEPDFLMESLRVISQTPSEIGFMWTGLIRINNNKQSFESWTPQFNKTSYFTFLNELRIGTNSGITIKKEVFDVCGYFDNKLMAAEDTDFFLRITQQFDFTYTSKHLIKVYKDGKDRLSKCLKLNAQAYAIIFPKHKDVIDKSKALQKKYYYKMMWLSFHTPDKNKAIIYFAFLIHNRLYNLKTIVIFLTYFYLPLYLATLIHKFFSKAR